MSLSTAPSLLEQNPLRGKAVLFDRDGTLIHDVPYNGDPSKVVPIEGALAAIERVRVSGLPLGVITNQSGIGRGIITAAEAEAVNRRVDEIFGGFDTWQVCPHSLLETCLCRKPLPGLIHKAAVQLGVASEDCVVIGDIGSDINAALSAGGRGILVPTKATRFCEIAAAPQVAPDILSAVRMVVN